MIIDDSQFTDKDSKRPEYRKLYEETDDYIEAYSKHTDARIKNDGPAQAIGGDWDEHGPLQLQFLMDRGLMPESYLLDFGCGTGRFARHVVPYLAPGHYVGIDISEGCITNCMKLAVDEGFGTKDPRFILGDGTLNPVKDMQFNVIWAHSVFTHLPPEIIADNLKTISEMLFGFFFFTYKKRDQVIRTGLKQFGYTPEWFIETCKPLGLVAKPLPDKWPQGQSCMVITRADAEQGDV